MGVYAVSLQVVKNYILVGDLFKSVFLLRWLEQTQQLLLLGRDHDDNAVMSVGFLVDQQVLGLVVADEQQNMSIMAYNPFDLHSQVHIVTYINCH